MECPTYSSQNPRIVLAHGSGGKMMHQLLEQIVLPSLLSNGNNALSDSAEFNPGAGRLAFTTDAFVVNPLFFPGGNIGSLAVHGTINDLAMVGARPRFLAVSLIIEEGLPARDLEVILQSLRAAADQCDVEILTGDTKVVDRGKGDGLFINTTGIGLIEHEEVIDTSRIRVGDVVIVSGDLGRHGMSVMACREGLAFETDIISDSAPLHPVVLALLDAGVSPHCLRDITRGGLASALHELATASQTTIEVREADIAVAPSVANACELLGLDPLHVACEGRFAMIVPQELAERALEVLRNHSVSENATIMGKVLPSEPFPVVLKNRLGVRRVLNILAGEQLPRIC